MPMTSKTEIIGQTAHKLAARAPEILSGTGASTSVAMWLSDHQSLITACSGIVGAVVAVLGLVWMVYRDVKKMKAEQRQ